MVAVVAMLGLFAIPFLCLLETSESLKTQGNLNAPTSCVLHRTAATAEGITRRGLNLNAPISCVLHGTAATAEGITRRALGVQAIAASSALLLPVKPAIAENLAYAYFSSGDPRFLQPKFDEIKYAGVKNVEVGSIGSSPAIRVAYDKDKIGYKRIIGTFWRACDPVSF